MAYSLRPISHNIGTLVPKSAVYSVNTICKMIDADSHCWIAMRQIAEYVHKHKREYSLVNLYFMSEYYVEHGGSQGRYETDAYGQRKKIG